MEFVRPLPEHEKSVHRCDRKTGRNQRRQRHVQDLVETGGIQHRRDRIDLGRLAVHLRNPAGAFIQAFAVTTKIADSIPLTATSTPQIQCRNGESRSQP
jgi:hypothetical protein